jgi:hypothetical protein
VRRLHFSAPPRCEFAASRKRRSRSSRLRRRLPLAIALVLAIAALGAAVARGQAAPPCKELETTQPAADNAQDLIELQPNPLEPTFSVQLDDHSAGDDDITFLPKGGQRPGTDADVAAEFNDVPRYKGNRLGGERFIAAHAGKSGRSIVLFVCFDKVPAYAAGRYEGTVSLYGPKLADFTYPIVVTTKWPKWIAWLAIGITIVGSLIVGLLTGSLSRPAKRSANNQKVDWKGWLRLPFAFVLAVALALLPYWSVYASNETWGSTPPSDLTALVTATFAAAIGGFATAKKLLSP